MFLPGGRLGGVAGKLQDLHGKGWGVAVLSARRHKHPAPCAGRGTGMGTAGLVARKTVPLMPRAWAGNGCGFTPCKSQVVHRYKGKV